MLQSLRPARAGLCGERSWPYQSLPGRRSRNDRGPVRSVQAGLAESRIGGEDPRKAVFRCRGFRRFACTPGADRALAGAQGALSSIDLVGLVLALVSLSVGTGSPARMAMDL